MSLYDYFLKNTGRPIHKNLHYFPIYERHFARFINRPMVFLEIGTGGGGAVQMWRSYFGPLAKIITVDIRPECAEFSDEQVSVYIGDQSNPEFLESIIQKYGPPDIVLDDGSHVMDHINATFRYLYSRIAWNGVYMVEDLHTAYWENFGGGLRKEGTFIENCKNMIDELNADYVKTGLVPTEFTNNTLSMHFYDSVVAFEKGTYVSKASIITGDKTKAYG